MTSGTMTSGSTTWGSMKVDDPLDDFAHRAITLDGAGASAIAGDLAYLSLTTLAFLGIGAWSFRWRIE